MHHPGILIGEQVIFFGLLFLVAVVTGKFVEHIRPGIFGYIFILRAKYRVGDLSKFNDRRHVRVKLTWPVEFDLAIIGFYPIILIAKMSMTIAQMLVARMFVTFCK